MAPPGPGAPFLARIQGMSIPRVSSCSSLNTVDRKGNVYCRVSSDNITFFFLERFTICCVCASAEM